MHYYKKILVLLIILLVYLPIKPAQAENFGFESAQACITKANANVGKAHLLMLELAQNNKQRARGLMERTELGDFEGMLFIYPRAAVRGFWMYRTLIPLDIAFINAQGVVLEIQQMTPCPARRSIQCPSYAPSQPYTMALEMATGRFAALGIQTGSVLKLGACPATSVGETNE